ncbi:MAG: gamma carbonic anhydrase family protein [Micromonosporaceae bacterium]
MPVIPVAEIIPVFRATATCGTMTFVTESRSGAPERPPVSGLIGAIGEHAPSIHPDAWVAPGAIVVGRVSIGPAASVWYGSVLRADDDDIVVGADCNIQDQCCLHVDPGEPAILEDRVTIGHRAVVHGAYVEAGALIGIGAIVLGGCRIGAGSLVAAGAVVTPGTRVPGGVLVAGVPAKIRRELTDADRQSFAGTPERYVRRAARHKGATWRQAPASGA